MIAAERRDVARRLILLVDTLYDHRVKLIVSAAAEPAALYAATSGEESFAFRRTVSRLIEMRSEAYLGAAHVVAEAATGERFDSGLKGAGRHCRAAPLAALALQHQSG